MIFKIISIFLLLLGYKEHRDETTGVQWCCWVLALAVPHLPKMFGDFMNGDENIRRQYTIGLIILLTIPIAFALLE